MRRAPLVLLLALAACPGTPPPEPPPRPTGVVAPPPAPPPEPRADGRLPALATPVRYSVALDVDPTKDDFSGTTRITIDVPAPTRYVVVNARGLTVTSASAIANGQTLAATTQPRVSAGGKVPEELVLGFASDLPAGQATLVLAHRGAWGDDLEGLYRIKHEDRWYAFTQFEAANARRAFPCFDEPAFKAPFELTVTTPKDMLAVANTPEVERKPDGDRMTFRFAPTKPLPSYLVALAVGALDVRESTRTTEPKIRIVTTKGRAAQADLALEATGALVDALAKWFGIPYPYEKLDIVAVPEFAAGAMENAGLVTFREELLLLDPVRASIRMRRAQASVIAHELAHQWFGNLVTAAWWDDLWLNEGMATWMESRIVDRWQPTWGARLDAIAEGLGAMDEDSLSTSRAVRQPVVTTGEAEEAFDGITYEKGAAVLSTIERWVGEDAFRKGIRAYLEENSWKSVHADKLLGALDRATGKDVTQMASGFLDRPGVPVVEATLACERGARWNAEITQEPWRPVGTKAPEAEDKTWMIPVCALAPGEKKPICAELAHGAPSLLAGRGCPPWIHPNADASYYRFALSEAGFGALAKAHAQLDVGARITLVSNLWATVRAGKLPAAAVLNVLPSFDDDGARQVTDQVIAILASYDDVFVDDASRPAFRKYVAARLGKKKNDLGWKPKDPKKADADEAILRRSVLHAMAEYAADDTTLKEAEELAKKWLADPTSVDADIAGTALDLASRRASAARVAELRSAIKNAKEDEDRVTALRALGGFDDPQVLEQALGLVLTDDIRVHDMRYVMGSAFERRASRHVAERFVRTHWDELRKKLPGSLAEGLVRAAGVACTKEEVAERRAFYGPRLADVENAKRALAQALEIGEHCADLRAFGATSVSRALVKRAR